MFAAEPRDPSALDALIRRWKDDPGGAYRSWFLWDQRIKNFRSIRAGIAEEYLKHAERTMTPRSFASRAVRRFLLLKLRDREPVRLHETLHVGPHHRALRVELARCVGSLVGVPGEIGRSL